MHIFYSGYGGKLRILGLVLIDTKDRDENGLYFKLLGV